MVEFCKKCDAIIIGKKGENTTCSACGHVQKSKASVELKQKIEEKKGKEVLNADEGTDIHPLTDIECPTCAHNKAYYWSKQTRAGDEPETMFFKCEKCKHQWREYR